MKIEQYEFKLKNEELEKNEHAKNWPVVYILSGEKEAYVGETANFKRRLKEHKKNEDRKSLTTIHIIDDSHFNKSAVLDIESELIRLMDADEKYKLQNSVFGQNPDHDYYERYYYKRMVKEIWKQLFQLGLGQHDYTTLLNSELFIYSPYKNLNTDQYETAKEILIALGQALMGNMKTSMAVKGNAGTGKSILAVYLLKVLVDIKNISQFELDMLEEDKKYEDGMLDSLLKAINIKDYKIGLVVPVTSFRETLKKVFHKVNGLKANMLLTPSDVVNAYIEGNPYDILLVDEAQRLKIAKNHQNIGNMYEKNKKLGLDQNASELDWILKCSNHQIFFYDKNQQVSGSDIDIEKLDEIKYDHIFNLTMQMRVQGGDTYISYIHDILSDDPPTSKLDKEDLGKYEVKIYDDVKEMYDDIRKKNDELNLCRCVAGFAWPWDTKKGKADYDIVIQGHKFVWNRHNRGWIADENSINEIGSIHTMQGQDLNCVGLIIGNDISYDFKRKKIMIHKESFYDVNAKKGMTDDEIKEHILHAYYILLSRARLGVYIYVCDDNFREYLRQFF